MTEPGLKTTLREFKEYLALSYESPREIAARIGSASADFGEWTSARARQFQTLTHPEHLGRPFQVLVQSRG